MYLWKFADYVPLVLLNSRMVSKQNMTDNYQKRQIYMQVKTRPQLISGKRQLGTSLALLGILFIYGEEDVNKRIVPKPAFLII